MDKESFWQKFWSNNQFKFIDTWSFYDRTESDLFIDEPASRGDNNEYKYRVDAKRFNFSYFNGGIFSSTYAVGSVTIGQVGEVSFDAEGNKSESDYHLINIQIYHLTKGSFPLPSESIIKNEDITLIFGETMPTKLMDEDFVMKLPHLFLTINNSYEDLNKFVNVIDDLIIPDLGIISWMFNGAVNNTYKNYNDLIAKMSEKYSDEKIRFLNSAINFALGEEKKQ